MTTIDKLNVQIALLEEENYELKLDNTRYRANIEQLWVNIEKSNDNGTITKFQKLLDANVNRINKNIEQIKYYDAKIKEIKLEIEEADKTEIKISRKRQSSGYIIYKQSSQASSISTSNESSNSQSYISSNNSKSKSFSAIKKNFITDICNDYNIYPTYFGEDIEWLDLPNDQMPSYEYKEFDWPSSKVAEIKNNKKPKYLVNESADTVTALKHLLEQINLFLKNKSLDSMFLKIKDASSDKSCNVNLNGFGSGRTDLIISSIHSDCTLLTNYCSIQLKPIILTKHEGSDNILKSSSVQDNTLSPQSFVELLAYTRISECPIMHCTTDLNQNFHIMFLLEIDNRITVNRYKLSAKKAIASIAIWLYYFCPHKTKNKNFEPKTQDLNLLASIQRAHQLIKKKLNSFDLWKSELTKLDEESEDSNSKCQKWVDLIN